MFRSILMLIALIGLTHPALADECTSRVYDTTGKVTDIAGIESTLKGIVGDGADPTLVRVITTAQMNEMGNLDKYAGSMLKRCPSWQSAGGSLKSNIFLMVVEPSGTIAILFNKKGPFQSVLGGKTQSIRNEMGGLLAKGDISGSIKAGLILTHSLLTAPRAAPVVASGPVTIVNHNEKPADLSGLWTFMKWLLGLGVIGVGIWLFTRYQSEKSKRNAAQQRAQNARGACTNLISGFDTHLMTISALMGSIRETISRTEYAAFQSKVEDLKTSMDSAKGQYASSSSSVNDPESSGLSVESYAAMTSTFERVQGYLERVDTVATKIENSIRGVGFIRDSAQPAIDELTREIKAATVVLNAETALRVDGPRTTLKLALDALERAEEKLLEKSYQAVLDACKEGSALAQKVTQDVKGLASRKLHIESTLRQVEGIDTSRSLTRLDAVIATTRQTYGADSVVSAPGHRATVAQKINERRNAIASAKSALNSQDWVQAENQIEIAQRATSAIASAINSIENIGPSILRQRKAREVEEQRAAEAVRRAASRSQAHHSSNQVTHIHHHVTRDDDGPGFGTGLALGALGALAVDSTLSNRREDRNYRSRSNDDDNSFGGGSGRAADPDPDPWGGDSGRSDPDPPSSPSNDFNND
jgi:hypothetical protein